MSQILKLVRIIVKLWQELVRIEFLFFCPNRTIQVTEKPE